MTAGIDAVAQAVCFPQTQVLTTQPRLGPQSIECYADEYLAIPGILERVLEAERSPAEQVDAYVIACWGDPGVDAARELTTKPVVGVAEASMYVANMLAARWGVVTTGHRVLDMIHQTIHKTGFGHRCVSIRTTGLAVVETETARSQTLAALVAAGREAIAQDRVEALCLGCAGMSGLDRDLEAELGIPVIDAVAAAVKLAESLVWLGKSTSKALTYQAPPAKPILGYDNIFQR